MTTQMPCLKLNGYSINPENDVALRPVAADGNMTPMAALKGCEQFGSTLWEATGGKRPGNVTPGTGVRRPGPAAG